ncbi:hypothetical protein D3C72_830930 [compost metagenome]
MLPVTVSWYIVNKPSIFLLPFILSVMVSLSGFLVLVVSDGAAAASFLFPRLRPDLSWAKAVPSKNNSAKEQASVNFNLFIG